VDLGTPETLAAWIAELVAKRQPYPSVTLSEAQLPRWEEERVAGEFLKKRERPKPGEAKVVSVRVDPGDVDLYPALVDFLTANQWPDGTYRDKGTLMVFVDQDRLKACLSDKANQLVLFITLDSLTLVLEACEDALKDDASDWRASKPSGRK
jgi:hypothetical protein